MNPWSPSPAAKEAWLEVAPTTRRLMLLCATRPRGGGITRYRDPSLCLFHGAAALGYRHAGCLQLSHHPPSEMCGLRTSPRTDVDPPRVELPSAASISSRRPRGDNLFVCIFSSGLLCSSFFFSIYTLSLHQKQVHRAYHLVTIWPWTRQTQDKPAFH